MSKEEFFKILNHLYAASPLSVVHIWELIEACGELEISNQTRAWLEEWAKA